MMETNVQLTIDGLKARLSNGILTVEFNENATVTSLIKNNRELVKNLNGSEKDPDRNHTFYVDYHAEGKFRNLTVTDLKVIKNTKDEVHITYIDQTSMLYFEYNILMKKGESGLYSYVVVKNNLGKEIRLSELRIVYCLDSSIFDHAYNAERTGKQPTHSYMSQFKLNNVRPGTYTLYAYATQGDITSEFQKDNIVVGNDDVNLGEIIWDPLYRKNKLWQIGKANRTAAFGNELRNYLPRLSFS